jgi:hypothetical protein
MRNEEALIIRIKTSDAQLYEIKSPKDMLFADNSHKYKEHPFEEEKFQIVKISESTDNARAAQELILKLTSAIKSEVKISSHQSEQHEHTSRAAIENSSSDTKFVFDSLTFTEWLINNWAITVSIATGAATVLKATKDILIAWINADASREIEIKYGEESVKIKGGKDIERFLKAIEKKDSKK